MSDTTEIGYRDIVAPVDQEGTKAVVRNWLKQSGAAVVKDEPIVELETDKVMVEVQSPCDGILEVVVTENQDAVPGAVLGRVRSEAANPLPRVAIAGFTAGEPVANHANADATQRQLRLSPSVRKLVAEHAIDPTLLQGSGRGGRLTRADVATAIAEGQPGVSGVGSPDRDEQSTLQRQVSTVGHRAETDIKAVRNLDEAGPHAHARGGVTQVPHSTMRRRIAEHMQQSVSTAPHVTAIFQADFSAIIAHRKKQKSAFAAQGVNLTFTAYFIAACVEAMRVVPEVNSRWHDDFLEVFRDVNIGIGAALGAKGLIVPVIHRAQDLSLLGIATRLQALTEAAREGKLKPADVQGGTFTISNHGVSGSLLAAPIIINQPQCAILGVGALQKRVVVREVNGADTLQILPCAYVSLTIDHRALDGSQTNGWLSRFVEVIERWPQEATKVA